MIYIEELAKVVTEYVAANNECNRTAAAGLDVAWHDAAARRARALIALEGMAGRLSASQVQDQAAE